MLSIGAFIMVIVILEPENFSISNILLSDSDADVIPGSIRDSMLCLTPNILMALASLRKERSKRNTVDTVKVRNTIAFLLMSVP